MTLPIPHALLFPQTVERVASERKRTLLPPESLAGLILKLSEKSLGGFGQCFKSLSGVRASFWEAGCPIENRTRNCSDRCRKVFRCVATTFA